MIAESSSAVPRNPSPAGPAKKSPVDVPKLFEKTTAIQNSSSPFKVARFSTSSVWPLRHQMTRTIASPVPRISAPPA